MTATRAFERLAAATVLDLTADNVAPIAPEVLAAVVSANEGYAAPYGADRWSARVSDAVAHLFVRSRGDGGTLAYAVASGVAANALALASVTAPGGAVFCHEHAHVRVSEHGAPEHQTGCELVAVADDGQGKIAAPALAAAIDRHRPPPGSALSITNLTEAGTVYSPAEVAALARLARERGLAVHLDGARLFNAAVAICEDPSQARDALASLTWQAGVDAVSLGLTKNGGMNADAVVFFDLRIAQRFPALRDRAGQRASKMRFLSAQLLAVAESDGWVDRAAHANRMARALAERLRGVPEVEIVRPVQANHVFARLGAAHRRRLERRGFRAHPWPRFGDGVVRLVTNWTTTPGQLRGFLDALVEQREAR